MINKNCGIYKITSPSGKIYIGLLDWLNGKYENKSKLRFVSSESSKSKPKNVGTKVKDTESGIIHNSMSEAARELNINLCNLRYWLKEDIKNKTTLIKYL